MYLVFDTETTGLPKFRTASWRDTNNWPRVIQLGWKMFNDDDHLEDQACDLIKPDGWVVPRTEFHLKHNLTTERCEAEGIPAQDALSKFIMGSAQCHTLVAHNIEFDLPVMRSECKRYGVRSDSRESKTYYCTCVYGADVCRIPGRYGRFKQPKLQELHTCLFGLEFAGDHDAMMDVEATARCYQEMKRLGFT